MRIGSQLFGYTLTLALMSAPSAEASPAPRQIMLDLRGDPQALRDAHKRTFAPHPTQSSGFWAQRGEILSVEVNSASRHSPELWIVPIGSREAKQTLSLQPGSNSIRAELNGVIYFVAPFNQQERKNPIHITLSGGGREMPRFVLGQHSKPDWHTMLQRLAREPYAELVGKRMIVTMPLALMRQHVDDPIAVLELWDKIVTLAEEQYGLIDGNPAPHHATPFQYQFVTKNDGHGYMSASTYWLGTEESGAADVANSQALQQSWGPWHELGHHYQLPAMTWEGMGEVTNNLTSLYVQRALGQRSRLETDQVWPQVTAYLAQSSPDYRQADVFVRLAMLWQLDLAFGRDFYSRLGTLYRSKPGQPASDEDKKQTFILEASRVSGHDLTPFFERWGLKLTDNTRRQLATLRLAPLTLPIWQNRDEAIRHTYTRDQQPWLKNQWIYIDKIKQRQYNSIAEFEHALAKQYGQDRFYHWDERVNRTGAVYFYQNPNTGRREYFMLQGAHTYFPGNGQSSHAWRYLGSSGDFVDIAEASAWQPTRSSPAPQPKPVVVISPPAPPQTSPKPAATATGAERELALRHGQSRLYHWDERVERSGAVYFYQNPYNGRREFFMSQGAHSLFPVNGQGNQDWRYLGSSADFGKINPVGKGHDLIPKPVAVAPPITAKKYRRSCEAIFLPQDWRAKVKKYHSQAELEQALIKQYGRLYQWHEQFAAPGSLYVFDNPCTGQREYFAKQQQTRWCAYFPTNGQSNHYWRYLGRSSDFILPATRWRR